MKLRPLGETGMECSEIGLGTWALGSGVYGEVERNEAHNLISQALDLGINFFDTAPLYGNKNEDGVAEVVLGEGLGIRKDQAIISTKFGRTARKVMPPRFNAVEAKRSCDESLKRLGRDWIDLLFFHSPFEAGEIEDDVWQALAELKEAGKIRFIGHSVSMYDDTKALSEQWMSERKIDAIQVVLSPFNRETRPLVETAAKLGRAVVARECMANGFLSGQIRKDTVFPEGSLNARYSREEIAERVEYASALSECLVSGEITSLPQAAYRWTLDQPGVSLALAGARSVDELMDGIRASQAEAYTSETLEASEVIHKKEFSPA
ncbi:MAG TPA: hypothetical protein DIV79_12630 [Opitutae bacterium]|nr:hypothetical protein [Opitutaceae bacterium]HCR30851.1 hypothetical protein [Opitutae bacterium]|tara:strand:+ start:235 stop:1197 length:963 start_codon:yes stop_codon:yes gene_type:complete